MEREPLNKCAYYLNVFHNEKQRRASNASQQKHDHDKHGPISSIRCHVAGRIMSGHLPGVTLAPAPNVTVPPI